RPSPKYREFQKFWPFGAIPASKGNILIDLIAVSNTDRSMPTSAAGGCGLRAIRKVSCCMALVAIAALSSSCGGDGASAAGGAPPSGGGGGKSGGRRAGGGDVPVTVATAVSKNVPV